MKCLVSLFVLLSLSACDFTAIESSICQNNLSDMRGFDGRYSMDVGQGHTIPVSVSRVSRGNYSLLSDDGVELMSFQTCKVSGLNIAESLVEEGVLAAFKIELSSRSTVIKTLQFVETILDNNGVSYQVEETEIEGIPLSMIQIDNSRMSSQELVNLSVSSNGKEPFYIELTK
ncbi:MAG: hypothetical protein CME65_09375 [Halobacteriovoraceae bacterium]|nr:hypothetical protein [Halobacteriovoraceae bacterium]|tara:strand:- start:1658 stop:2176 length:519 start_codon:yes stop_codon:yes gene_type:complete